MKKILVLICCCFVVTLSAQISEIQLAGAEQMQYHTTLDGISFYAIKDATGAGASDEQIVLTLPGNFTGWICNVQRSYQNATITIPLDENNYNPDSSAMHISIPGDGLYTINAVVGTEQYHCEFYVFYDHVPAFSITLSDTMNCDYIKVDPLQGFIPPFYDHNGTPYEGIKEAEYLLSSRSVPFPGSYNYLLGLSPSVAVGPENQTISVTITDQFGITWQSESAEYVTVIPEAIAGIDPVAKTGEAPLEVKFKDNSSNAAERAWYLYTDTTDFKSLMVLEDSLIDRTVRYDKEFGYTYEHPGYYGVKLIAINTTSRCADTTELEYINVHPSLVDVPNVFTPNGDGVNDIFRVKTQSLESFYGVILNRWERKVYEWRNPEDGWDGRINGKYASPGTYFYIIKAKGREKNSPPNYLKKGSLLLVR